MQIAWQDLLFSDTFDGKPNKPFERFLFNTTRVANVGHNQSSIDAHQKAIHDLSIDDWEICLSFEVDQRLVNEVIEKKLSLVPGIGSAERNEIIKLSLQFAQRKQAKQFLQSRYLERLRWHYQKLNMDKPSIDWQWLLYRPANKGSKTNLFQSCENIANRIFWKEELARQACDAVLKKMSDNHWQKLSGYQGKGSAEGYFKKVFHTQAQDFFKALYGSCQPKTWIRNAGDFMVALFKKLCCEKIDPKELLENSASVMRGLHPLEDINKNNPDQRFVHPEDLRSCIRLILAKEVSCQQQKVEEVNESATLRDDQGISIIERYVHDDFEENIEHENWKGTLLAIQIMIGNASFEQVSEQITKETIDLSAPQFEVIKKLTQLLSRMDEHGLKKMQLTDNEKLILQHRYMHSKSIKETSELMSFQLKKSIKPHQVVYSERLAIDKLNKLLDVG